MRSPNLPWALFLSVLATAYCYKATAFPGALKLERKILPSGRKECNTVSYRMSSQRMSTGTDTPMLPNTVQKTSNLTKRWITGLSLGALCSGWIASGNQLFAAGFLVASYIMHDEYTKMVQATGPTPAFRLGILTSIACFLSAAMFPSAHELIVPTYISLLMGSVVLSNSKTPAKISDIAASVLGVIYTGYLPSFWVRMRSLTYPNYMQLANPTSAIWTMGAATTWWTWTSIVFADVGAYFIGKKFGRHKLNQISAAAGAASPNKSIEGALAGFVSCSLLSVVGAYVMHWPAYLLTGSLYGLLISVLGLLGDLTASIMKRDAGVKDTGSILPGHGGLLDRFDSYILSAPVAFWFVKYVLPMVDRLARTGAIHPLFMRR